ncbi:uncharacterized protein LOC130630533 [Hydractinia symbiolongicarpus]|uniref:uncharacterized protein LOC130630533 n=1 Tax=Hydractinia symbiolongicarpus TaxID=13093 RepID=UPI00254C55D0|nr:uncharacterized protein LOC130630533 [Hydractinia symbiolongicarpus]
MYCFLLLMFIETTFIFANTRSNEIILVPYNYPGYIIGFNEQQDIYVVDDVEYRFRIVKGLNGEPSTISLQFGVSGNSYVTHNGSLVYLQTNDNTFQFKQKASFYPRLNKFVSGYVALESSSKPGHFLRLQNYTMKLHAEERFGNFKKDASLYNSTITTGLLCESQKLKISCQLGESIKFVYGMYGHDESVSICGYDKHVSCASTTSLSTLKKKCFNKQSCKLFASNSWFGDPCVGVKKYLKVIYYCVKSGINNEEGSLAWIAGPVIFVICCLCYVRRRRAQPVQTQVTLPNDHKNNKTETAQQETQLNTNEESQVSAVSDPPPTYTRAILLPAIKLDDLPPPSYTDAIAMIEPLPYEVSEIDTSKKSIADFHNKPISPTYQLYESDISEQSMTGFHNAGYHYS